jgi:fumarate reductase flavoprotein subunit
MTEKGSKLTRRKFIAASSAAIAAPVFMGMLPEAKAAEKATKKTAEKNYNFIDKKICDLVVLGGGGSGLVAAVRAAQVSGKKVIVLEKDSSAGGGAQGARTIRTFGSKWQEKRNLSDKTLAYAREVMNSMYWRVDARLANNCLRGTGQFFDWLCEQGGDIEEKFAPGKYALSTSENEPIGPQMAGMGKFVMDMMKEKCQKYGVEVLTEHPVVDVEVKNGKIVAAIAKSKKGYVRVACKACVLATGSWIRNEEIVKKYLPNFAAAMQYITMGPGGQGNQIMPAGGQGTPPGGQAGAPGGQAGGPGGQGMPQGGQGGSPAGPGSSNVGHLSPNYTGDGIALAEKVGAFVDYSSFCVRPMGPMHGMGEGSQVFNAMAQSPYIITVNLDGKRYVCEPISKIGVFSGGAIQMEQPKGLSYDIFDENTIAASLKLKKATKTTDSDQGVIRDPISSISLPDTEEEIQKDIKQNVTGKSTKMFKADTLEELSDKIGVNKKNFLETIRNYNEGCITGNDECFKDKQNLAPINKPPYYAYMYTLGTDGAFGGVQVNPEMQAYKPDHNLVEGLYVTGDFASGRFINTNGMKIYQIINDLPWAFSSGFLAGTNVAKYLESIA